MSGTKHHGKRHGLYQWREDIPGAKPAYKRRACGYEYWSRRGAPGGSWGAGPDAKRMTHRLERRRGALAARSGLRDFNEEGVGR